MATTYSYTNLAIREDLLDIMTNVSPTETQLFNGLSTSAADQPIHQWLTKALSAVKTNAYVEGADASYPALTNPARLINYTQIFRNGYQVSGSDRAAVAAAFSDRYKEEALQAMTELRNDIELALMRGSIVCGSGSAARQLRGIKNWLSLVTAQSGTSLAETTMNDYFNLAWDNGVEINAVYVPMVLKRRISGFTAGATKNVNLEDKRLVNAVDVYQADAAKMVKLFAHKYVRQSGDNNYDFVGIDENMFRIAYFRKPKAEERAKTGDATKGEVLTELTLECLHQYGGVLGSAHL